MVHFVTNRTHHDTVHSEARAGEPHQETILTLKSTVQGHSAHFYPSARLWLALVLTNPNEAVFRDPGACLRRLRSLHQHSPSEASVPSSQQQPDCISSSNSKCTVQFQDGQCRFGKGKVLGSPRPSEPSLRHQCGPAHATHHCQPFCPDLLPLHSHLPHDILIRKSSETH